MHVSPRFYIVLTVFQIFCNWKMMFVTSQYVLKLKNVVIFLKITICFLLSRPFTSASLSKPVWARSLLKSRTNYHNNSHFDSLWKRDWGELWNGLLVIQNAYTGDFAECSFHHCLVSSTSPAAFRRRPWTELDNLEINGATSHSGPFMTTDFWLLWAVAKGVVSCRCTKTLMALVAMASRRGPVS